DLSIGAASPLAEGMAMDRRAESPTQCTRPSPRRRDLRAPALLLTAALVAIMFPGCQIIVGSLLSLQGRPKTTCEFTRMTHGKSLEEKGKKVVVVSTSTA